MEPGDDAFRQFLADLDASSTLVAQHGPCRLTRRGSVLWLALERAEGAFNIIDRDAGHGLRESIQSVEKACARGGVGAVVFVSRKPRSFVVGADIGLQVRSRRAAVHPTAHTLPNLHIAAC